MQQQRKAEETLRKIIDAAPLNVRTLIIFAQYLGTLPAVVWVNEVIVVLWACLCRVGRLMHAR